LGKQSEHADNGSQLKGRGGRLPDISELNTMIHSTATTYPIHASEDVPPTLSLVLDCQLFFVLYRLIQDLVLSIRIVSCVATVNLLQQSLSPLAMIMGSAPS
jgi:hypothetical protein